MEQVTIEQIWQIPDRKEMFSELYEYLADKCDFECDMSALSRPERVFYVTHSLQREVEEVGFETYFYRESGDFANEIAAAYAAMGAEETSLICRRALSAFGEELPTFCDDRQELMDELESDELSELLEECDDAFNEKWEDLDSITYEYIMKNKAYFN